MDNSFIWQPSLRLLNQDRIEQLHEAATAILEKTGLNVHHPQMQHKLADSGAKLGEGCWVGGASTWHRQARRPHLQPAG